ncbi:glycosyltransferase family 4 protein [Mariniflexile sp. HMF6888]|uniref:glycosyltransferase family 4 protein n=1 Tax=Mariniflexile sp. HMF6888 TaxID=3373086 RepID=UPI0037B46DA4
MKKKFIIVSTVSETLNFFRGQIEFLNKTFDIELLSSYDQNLKNIAEKEGVKYHSVKMERPISIFKDIKSLISLISLFKKTKPHIVHGNTPKGGLLSMTAAWFARIPHRIYYIHGLRYEGDKGLKRYILVTMERLTCYFATDIIAVSFGVKENLTKNNITKKQILIIGKGSANGIDPKEYSETLFSKESLRDNYDIAKSDFLFGYVGRLVSDKGINELISVFVKINKKYPHSKLLMLGRYEDELDPLQDHIKNEIITNNNIIAVGYQYDVKPFLNIMDAFILPSYREGFGVSIMEAALMGLPVICSNISGCNEIIKDGHNGKLIQPRSESDLIDAMDFFINNPESITKMKEVTKDYVLNKYNQEFVWQNALKTYQAISARN